MMLARRFGSLWVCFLLLGAVPVAPFPVLEHTGKLDICSARNEHLRMSLPSVRKYPHPLVSHNKAVPTKQLWYRDRSAAEEQMTETTVPANIPRRDTEAEEARPKETDLHLHGSVNLPLVQATCWSHARLLAVGWSMFSIALILNSGLANPFDLSSLHWNGDIAPFHSLLDWTVTPLRIVEGILATFPLVAMSSMIGNSDHAEFCPIHFSVANAVLSLFGRRRQQGEDGQGTSTLTVLLISLGIASISATSEELIFRGLLPATVVSYSHSVELAWLSQALLSGIGQVRRRSSLAENGVFSLMQSMNGLWYGTVYLALGGDILPVLVAHLLYECHIFVGAWKGINDQLDYTERTCSSSNAGSLPLGEQMELKAIQKEAGASLKPETLARCRRFFYSFDHDHQGSLSLADVKRAVAYAFLQDPGTGKPSDDRTSALFREIVDGRPSSQATTGSVEDGEVEDRLTLSEFLHLLFALKSKTWNSQLA